jgi:transposase
MELYCGIDLHSNNNYVSIIEKENRRLIKERRLPNDLGVVLSFLAPHREALAGVAVESTFNWYWLVDGLMEAGYTMYLANTNAAKQYEGLKNTEDRHDARWIAIMMALGILPTGYIYPKEERPLRDLFRRRAFLKSKRTSLLLSMRGMFESWTGERTNMKEMRGWTDDGLEPLLGNPHARLGISCMLSPVACIDEQIKIIEKQVTREAKLRKEFRKLKTVWGIGEVLALTVMFEVGDISRFPTVGDFASYCRLVGAERRSNNKRKGTGNRKNGNPYLSWAFTEAAHFANQYREPAKRFFQRKKSKTDAIVATRALAHKLARASFYVLRDNVDFDPEKAFG